MSPTVLLNLLWPLEFTLASRWTKPDTVIIVHLAVQARAERYEGKAAGSKR